MLFHSCARRYRLTAVAVAVVVVSIMTSAGCGTATSRASGPVAGGPTVIVVRDDANGKDRHPEKNLVEGKSGLGRFAKPIFRNAHYWSVRVLECWSVENPLTPFRHYSITPLSVTLLHTG